MKINKQLCLFRELALSLCAVLVIACVAPSSLPLVLVGGGEAGRSLGEHEGAVAACSSCDGQAQKASENRDIAYRQVGIGPIERTQRLSYYVDKAQIVVDGSGHVRGPLAVVYYALTEPTGEDIYPLGAASYALFGLYHTGSKNVRISELLPNRVSGSNWGKSDAEHLNLAKVATVNLRLNGLNTASPEGYVPIGSLGSDHGPQVEVKNVAITPANVDVTLIGAPVVNQIVAHIDYTQIVTASNTGVRAPYIDFYRPGDPAIPVPDVKLQLEPFGDLVSSDGATIGQRYWLRNVAFRSGGNIVSDQQREYAFLFDTAKTLTIVGDRAAIGLGLPSLPASFSCYGGKGNGYILDAVTMVGISGSYRVNNVSVCWANAQVQTGDVVIGSNLFDQVQILLDGPNAVLGIKHGAAKDSLNKTAPNPSATSEEAAFYPFDGNANDTSTHGNHGSVDGAVLTPDRQCNPNSSSYRFDGKNDAISVADSASLHFSDEVSLVAWVYPMVQKTQQIVAKGPYVRGPDASPYGLALDATGNIIFQLRLQSDLEPTQVAKSGYSVNEWFLVAGIYDGSTMSLYVNDAPAITKPASGLLNQSHAPLLIGTGLNLETNTFQGRIDDVRIYDHALSAGEVQALYHSSLIAQPESSSDQTGTGGSKGTVRFAIVNESATPACYVYVSQVGSAGANVERSCGDEISPGGSYWLSLPQGGHEVLLRDCSGNVTFYRSYVDVFPASSLHLTDIDIQATACNGPQRQGKELFSSGSFAQALEYFQAALTCYRNVPYRFGEGEALNNIAAVYQQQGRYAEALDLFYEAQRIAQEVGNRDGESAAVNGISAVDEKLGRLDDALVALESVLTIRRDLHDQAGEATILANMATIYSELGRYQQAQEAYQQILAMRRATHDRLGEANTLNNIAHNYLRRAQYKEAFETFEQALAIVQAPETQNPLIAGAIWGGIGQVHAHEGRFDAALEAYQQALAKKREIGDRAGEGSNLASIAHVLDNLGRTDEALRTYLEALEALEEVRALAGGEAERASFISQYEPVYQRAIALHYRQGLYAEAFRIAERARARSFLDLIGNQRVDFRKDTAPKLIEQQQTLLQQIADLQSKLEQERAKPIGQQSPKVIDKLATELKQAAKDYATLLRRLKVESPEYASFVSVDTLSLAEVQSQVLDEQTTLIEYFVLDDYTLAWVVDRDGFELVRLDIGGDELRRRVEFLRSVIDLREFDPQLAVDLYDNLFAPIKPKVHHANLVIVPHSVLHYLPFAALWNAQTGRYLVQDYSLTFAPSASALRFTLGKRNADQGRLLALGNPDGSLPEAAKEVQAIADLYKTTPLVGAAASESQVQGHSQEVDLLHLAAHAQYNQYNPLFSDVELAPGDGYDGKLMVHEVFELNLKEANLVVLSACQTALGAQSEGDELVGLTRAFLYAGAPAAVTTLWSVEAGASSALMESFYGHLREEMTNAAALQKAQLEVLDQDAWKSPFYWAAFVLTGDYQGNTDGMVYAKTTAAPEAVPSATQEPTNAPTAEAPPSRKTGGGLPCGSIALPIGATLLTVFYRRRHTRYRP